MVYKMSSVFKNAETYRVSQENWTLGQSSPVFHKVVQQYI